MNFRYALYVFMMLILVGCGSSKERELQYLEKAKSYASANNHDKARIELQNVLQINPKNTEARYLMAQLAEKDQDWQKMYDLLSGLVADQPDFMDAQVKLGGLFLLSGEQDKALEKVAWVLDKQPNNAHAMTLKAALLLRDNDKTGAEALLQKVITIEPDNLEATYLLIKAYDDTKDYQRALKTAEAAIALHPEEVNLALMKVQILTWMEKHQQAELDMLALLKRFPENNQLYYSAAKYYVMTRHFDKAEQVLRDLIAKQPKASEPKLALIEYLLSQKNEVKAEQVLSGFIKENPGDYEYSFALVALYKDKADKAMKVLSQIIESDPHGPNGLKAKNILAIYAENKGDKAQALQLVEQVIAEDPHNAEALMLHSSLLVEQGQYDAAIADLRTVLRDQPNSEKALILSARTHVKSGYFDLAQESLENVLAINPSNINVRKDLARMLVKNKDSERAISLLESVENTKQKNTEALSMLVDLYSMNKAWDKAEEAAKAIAPADNKGLSAYKLAQVYAAQKKYPLALNAYQDVLKLNSLNIDALAGLTDVYLAMGEPSKAGAELDKLLAANTDNIDLLNLRGFLYKNQKLLPDAERVFLRVLKLKKTADFAYQNLASVYLMQNQYDKALSLYQQGLNVMPGNPHLMLGLAEIYEKANNLDAAVDVYTKLLKSAPENKIAANNLAALVAIISDDPTRLSQAYELVKSFKNSNEPAMLDTYGWLSFLNGQVDAAVSALERVVELDSDFVEFNYHLGMVYAAKSRTEEAKMVLRKALSKNTEFPGKAKAKAKLAELEGA